jgi:hypothetical protein
MRHKSCLKKDHIMKNAILRSPRVLSLFTLIGLSSGAFGQSNNDNAELLLGPGFRQSLKAASRKPAPPPRSIGGNIVERWNQIAINASGIDHTPVAAGETRVFGEQIGPCRSARAIAICQVAVFEAVNAISGDCKSYLKIAPLKVDASQRAAVAQAARDSLVALFPSQAASFDAYLKEDLIRIPNGAEKDRGIALGKNTAAKSLAARANDGSLHKEPRLGTDYTAKTEVGKWRQDPISRSPVALGLYWGQVKPFVMTSGNQFRLPPPPALNSVDHTMAYVEVKRLGGDGVTTPTERVKEEDEIGIFWAYDGMPSLCAPPRLYNQVVRVIAKEKKADVKELARLLALANVAMADTAIAAWDSKWHYEVARPITLIRESESDGNVDTVGDTTFAPIGAPASNLAGPNFTPPFPAYPSGHAAFGGAIFQVLRRFYKTDRIPFTFTSDEFNGVTRDNSGQVRPLLPRSFKTMTEAEVENADSRIYLGIHWNYDATSGITQGRNVGNLVSDRLYKLRKN